MPELGLMFRILRARKEIMKRNRLMPLLIALGKKDRKKLAKESWGLCVNKVLGFEILREEDLSSAFYQTYLGCLTLRME